MGKTTYIRYKDAGFWAYDVAVGVFLKHLIDSANQHVESKTTPWLVECIDLWRMNAVINEYGLHLDETWTDMQRQHVRALIAEACHEMQKIEYISAKEAASWDLLDGGVDSRGEERIFTKPCIQLAQAVSLLLDGSLNEPPPGYWWFYGVDGGVLTIQKRASIPNQN